MIQASLKWDVFISHASEDKESFVRPLAIALKSLGLEVWYDEFALRVGDSLSRSIDQGLAASRYGIVVISQDFIGKSWPERELQGLVAMEVAYGKKIIPMWHGVTRDMVLGFSPTLADKIAIDTSNGSAQDAAIQVLREVRPDLYEKIPREKLERLASGKAAEELQAEIDRIQEKLEETRKKLAEFQCPYCHSSLIEQIYAGDWGLRAVYECGYESSDGSLDRPCPADPRFPKFEDYELKLFHKPGNSPLEWMCFASPKTSMAQHLSLSGAWGRTEEEAKTKVAEEYDRYARKGLSSG